MSRKYRPTKIKRSGISKNKNNKKDLHLLMRILLILILMFFAGRIFVTLLYPSQVNQIEVEIPRNEQNTQELENQPEENLPHNEQPRDH